MSARYAYALYDFVLIFLCSVYDTLANEGECIKFRVGVLAQLQLHVAAT